MKNFIEFLNESSTEIEFKGKKYFVDTKSLEDKTVKKLFAYEDSGLRKLVKSIDKTLMFDKKELDDKLKK